jgi:uncharacterized protein Yka (UPF0111/DUF47 family)
MQGGLSVDKGHGSGEKEPHSPKDKKMLLRLYRSMMPKEDRFVTAFTSHAAVVAQAGVEFRALMEPGADVAAGHGRIRELEHAADRIERETTVGIRATFLQPFDRGDILLLVQATDNIVDSMKDATQHFVRYGTDFSPQMRGMADCVVIATAALRDGIPLLNDVGRSSDRLLAMCETVGDLESQADKFYNDGLDELFPSGTRPGTITTEQRVMEGVYDFIETVADRCEDLSKVIASIVTDQV